MPAARQAPTKRRLGQGVRAVGSKISPRPSTGEGLGVRAVGIACDSRSIPATM